MIGGAVAHLAPTPEPKVPGELVLVREDRTPGSVGVTTRSRVRTCYNWRYNQDVTQCSAIGTLPGRATGVIWWCEALGTM